MKTTYSTGEAAQILSVDPKTVLNWIASGKLDAEKQRNGSRFYNRVSKSSVDKILAQFKKADQQEH